uniref:Ripply transcriptional repressor 2 n=1 Tax=Stegastes partitus TaxID=144197 RepID=A0A3B5BBI3_9TELE
MEAHSTNRGLTPVLSGASSAQQPDMWRPWSGNRGEAAPCTVGFSDFSCLNLKKMLYWPKSRCFDYLYQDAQMLLRNYPVQATICPYQDSSSDEESDDDDEEVEKELN